MWRFARFARCSRYAYLDSEGFGRSSTARTNLRHLLYSMYRFSLSSRHVSNFCKTGSSAGGGSNASPNPISACTLCMIRSYVFTRLTRPSIFFMYGDDLKKWPSVPPEAFGDVPPDRRGGTEGLPHIVVNYHQHTRFLFRALEKLIRRWGILYGMPTR